MKIIEFDGIRYIDKVEYNGKVSENIPVDPVVTILEDGTEVVSTPADYGIDIEKLESELFVEEKLSRLKLNRSKEANEIVITLSSGEVLNGDETSQSRIGRAILGLPDDTTEISWIGANGDVYQMIKPKFQEALTLAGQSQTEIWTKYAELKAELLA